MSKENIRNKIHELVDRIEDEDALNILKEEAEVYITQTKATADNLTAEQRDKIEVAKKQIQNGQYKNYSEVKEHFALLFA